MAQYFECKVRYDKTMENGCIKRVTETYLVDALTFTEAEKRFIEEVAPYFSGESEVSVVKKVKLADVFRSNDAQDDRYYKARIVYITLDEKTGAEKRTAANTLIQAKDLKTALAHLEESMKDCMGDWEAVSLTETPIIDIIDYKDDEGD